VAGDVDFFSDNFSRAFIGDIINLTDEKLF